jgi:predicted Zn-ribbon and HTH transcriptional regulator
MSVFADYIELADKQAAEISVLAARLAEAEQHLWGELTCHVTECECKACQYRDRVQGIADSASRCTWCGPERINTDPCPVCGSTVTVTGSNNG